MSDRLAWIAVIVLLVAAPVVGFTALRPHSIADRTPHDLPVSSFEPAGAEGDVREALARLPERDPFRASRRPAAKPYDPAGSSATAPKEPPRPPVPALHLAGVILGAHSMAVIEGIPGMERGMLLQVGDTAGGIQMVRLRGETATLRGLDTVWTLSLEHP